MGIKKNLMLPLACGIIYTPWDMNMNFSFFIKGVDRRIKALRMRGLGL
jgi:hypothetical protein